MTIAKVVLVNIDTGEETVLSGREHSRCFFTDWFRHNYEEIQFRIDYNNDPSVDPVLDADRRNAITKEHIKPTKKDTYHHTRKKYEPESKMSIYTFKFEDLTIRLYNVTTHQLTTTSNAAVFTDSLKTTLARGENS